MRTSNEALRYCESRGITVEHMRLPHVGIMSAEIDGECYVIIDDDHLTEKQRLTRIAHEIGHCETGTFYNPLTPLRTRSRCECRANKWTIKKILPKGRMLTAFKRGYTEVWQLSDYFGIEEDLVRFACREYFDY